MKKLLAFLLALMMLFSAATVFAGCEDSGKKKSSSSKDDEDEDEDDEDDEDEDEDEDKEGDEDEDKDSNNENGADDENTDDKDDDAEPTEVTETEPIDEEVYEAAAAMAESRVMELVNLYTVLRNQSGSVSQADMEEAILSASLSAGYKSAISNDPAEVTNEQLLQDYYYWLEKFHEELETDYLIAQDSFGEEPYNAFEEFKDPVFCFMYLEGFVSVEYGQLPNGENDYNTIESMTPMYPSNITDQEAAIEYVFEYYISEKLDIVLLYSVTSSEILTEYTEWAVKVLLDA